MHDICLLADIIKSEHFDIVALQEVFKEEAINKLIRHLPGWEGSHGRGATGSIGDFGLGFIWNKSRLQECSKLGQPIIYNEYKSDTRMSRNPFYGRFTPVRDSFYGRPVPFELLGGPYIQFRLINIHLRGSSSCISQRKDDLNIVSGMIYKKLSSKRYGAHEYMPSYTIVLGDFNLHCNACNTLVSGNHIEVFQDTDTTITNREFVSSFDHFAYNKEMFGDSCCTSKRVNSVVKYTGNNFEHHFKFVSNHVPVKLIFDV